MPRSRALKKHMSDMKNNMQRNITEKKSKGDMEGKMKMSQCISDKKKSK
jgi:hypothetical protein